MGKETKSSLNEMAVLTLDCTVLLMGVWTRHSVFNANLLEILV
jgi:hypothetical protein